MLVIKTLLLPRIEFTVYRTVVELTYCSLSLSLFDKQHSRTHTLTTSQTLSCSLAPLYTHTHRQANSTFDRNANSGKRNIFFFEVLHYLQSTVVGAT
jgi:hypothetical protein